MRSSTPDTKSSSIKSRRLYTRAMLQDAFSDYRDLSITDEEREMHEGTSHRGMSAVINLTARKLT